MKTWDETYLEVVQDPRFKLFGMDTREILQFREIKDMSGLTAREIYDQYSSRQNIKEG
jgi:hypothetical protein